MPYVELSDKSNSNITIMIFTEGTIIMHSSLLDLYDYSKYQPIGSCIEKINSWKAQDANIVYCTSRKERQVSIIADILKKHGFCGTRLYYRDDNQTYSQIVEQVKPNVLIEDNCKSIGGKSQMCITHVSDEIKQQIRSIAVDEFKGIDYLPTKISDLLYAKEV